jgi:hypothetical protein
MNDIIQKIDYVTIKPDVKGDIKKYIYPISESDYNSIKKSIAIGSSSLYKGLHRDEIVMFGDSAKIDYSLAEMVIDFDSLWMPATYDFINRRVTFTDKEGIGHTIVETSNKLKIWKYYISLLDNPKYVLVTKRKLI